MFFAERLERPAATQFTAAKAKQKNNLEKRGKLSKYDNVDQQMKKLPDASRLHEWQNYLKLDAVKVIDRSTAEEMISHGAEVLPTQWIDVDKNEALRAPGKTMEPKMKSGDLSALFNRSDSPTAGKQAVFLAISSATSRRLRIGSADRFCYDNRREVCPTTRSSLAT